MFFTSGIIIAFFCFSFYLIWDQFLRKDTRLNIGLQVLKKKIHDLENLSLKVDSQIESQMFLVNEKSQRMLSILETAEDLCSRLEKNMAQEDFKDNNNHQKFSFKKEVLPKDNLELNDKIIENSLKDKNFIDSSSAPTYLKMVKEKTPVKNLEKFGKSPFTQASFTPPS